MRILMFASVVDDAVEAISLWFKELFNSLWLIICQALYPLINYLYKLYDQVASINLFSEEVFNTLTGRIYVIMGIAMLFIFAYNLVFMVVNPDDKKGGGTTGRLVKETIISLTVVVLLPTIFNWLHVAQTNIIQSNVVGALVFGNTTSNSVVCDANDYECNCDFSSIQYLSQSSNILGIGLNANDLENKCKDYRNLTGSERGARSIGVTIFTAFYRPSNFSFQECKDFLFTGTSSKITSDAEQRVCLHFYYNTMYSKYTGSLEEFVDNNVLNNDIIHERGNMEFHWLYAIIAGGLGVWTLLCYSMEIGVRTAKLGFLELISPIPVMMRVLPPNTSLGGMYNKWFKQYTETFIDVFLRLFIINFCLFGISLVPDLVDALFKNTYGDGFLGALALVIIVLGLLKFAQDAPNLFKEFFGGSGKFSIRSPKAQLNDNKLAKKVIGYGSGLVAGGASALVRGKSPIVGALSNAKHSAHAMGTADLTKKDAFKGALRTGKKESDEAIKNNKFTAFRRKIEEQGGVFPAIDSMIDEKYTGLNNWLSGTTNDDKKQATSKIKSNIENVDDIVTENIKKKENVQKSNFENQRDVYLKEKDGQEYVYKRQSDGRWQKFDSSGGVVSDNSGIPLSSKSNEEMATLLKTTFDNQKKTAIVENLNNQDDFAKEWTSNFINILKDELPRLDKEEISQITTKLKSVVDADYELKGKFEKVNNMDQLIKKMAELRYVSVNGDKNDSETKEAQELFAMARSVIKSESNSINKRIYEQEKKNVATGKDEKK